MGKWEMVAFDDAIIDITRLATKIKKEDYLSEGQYQIIDQGKKYLAGYSNDAKGLCHDVPAIIFGDHTRILKYIDEPLFIGADGVKLLKVKRSDLYPRFVFYFLKSCRVIDTGYNRHYKWLKEFQVPLPPFSVQVQIADVLDRASALIEKRKAQIDMLDLLVKSQFIEMFGDPVANQKGWATTSLGELGVWGSGGTPPRSNPSYYIGDIHWYSAGELNEMLLKGSIEKISREAIKKTSAKLFPANSMFVGMYDTAAFKLSITPKSASSNQACANITPYVERTNIYWLYICLQIMRPLFLEKRRGIRQKNLNLGMIKSFIIPLPSIELQNQFASFVKRIQTQKSLLQKSHDKLELNYESLMQKYFKMEVFQ